MQQIRSALSLFNGISGLHLALDKAQINAEQVYYSEIDKFANKVTEQRYPNDIALGDVTKWKEWDIDWSSVDLVSAGFPCFAKGSSVLTKMGYKDISEVEIGDLVMTHKNRWKEVITLFHKENFIYKVKAQGLLETETTDEHPYLVSKMFRVNGKRVFSKPDWVEVKDLKVGDFICYPKILNENNHLNLTLDEAYLIGRYIADGHTTMHNRTETGRENERFYNLILSVGSHKIPNTPIKHHLHKHTQSTHRMVFSNKRLVNIVEEYCRRGAKNKVISPMLLELPKDLLEQLLCGLMDGDGSTSQKLECDNQEKTNSLTTAQKDNVVAFNNETVMKTGKTYCLTANYGGAWAKHSATKKVRTMVAVGFTQDSGVMTSHNQIKYRKLTPLECERLQTVPDNWTECLSNTQRYKSLGNGWTIDVIVHILECAFK